MCGTFERLPLEKDYQGEVKRLKKQIKKLKKKKQNLDKAQNGNDFIADVTHRFSKEDLWDAWWGSAIKTISFSGVDKDYERRCFEKFYENKLFSLNGG